MLKNYFLVTLRAFRKHKLYSLLNVFGLSLGLVVVLLVALFVRYEFSFDRFHERADRTYRVVQEQPRNIYLGSNRFAVTPAPLERAIADELPYVESVTQVNDVRAMVTTDDGPGVYEAGIYATPTFFDVFDFELLQGDPASVLAEPGSIVITPDLADRVFGTQDVVGKTFDLVPYFDRSTVTVTGVVAPPPANSHFGFSYVATYAGNENYQNGGWGSSSYMTYAVLSDGVDGERFEADVQKIVSREMGELSWIKEGTTPMPRFYLEPLTSIHLRSHINFDIADNGDIRYVYLLLFAAAIIILTACINYMNLATARAAVRAREVGVRKVSGADRSQLVRQFLGESVLMAFVAVALAVAAASLLLPAFSNLVERDIPRSLLFSVPFLVTVPLAALLVGVIAGSYPAFFLSRMVPAKVLKASGTMGGSRSRLRNALVVVQFAVGVVFVVGTVVIHRQIDYIRSYDTGMDRERVAVLTVRDRSVDERWPALNTELSNVPGVLSVTSASDIPTNLGSSNGVRNWDGHEGDESVSVYVASVNYGLIEQLDLELVEGRSFSEDHATDEGKALIINETAMRQFGWDSAVGKHLDLNNEGMEVVGVVKDFQFHSFQQQISPLAFYLDTKRVRRVLVKVAPGDVGGTVTGLRNVMATFAPAYPFEYEFLDDAYNAMYRSEQRLGIVLSSVSALAIMIACLGLFGLAAYMALQRTKEIGVRKALGAGVRDIILLLSRDFGKLILIAFVVGSPIAFIVMRRWLERYAFHTEVGPGVFVIAAVFVLAVAALSVGYQSLKASLANPVDALRNE